MPTEAELHIVVKAVGYWRVRRIMREAGRPRFVVTPKWALTKEERARVG